MSFKEKIASFLDSTKGIYKSLFKPKKPYVYKGKDGLERNITKMRHEYKLFQINMRIYWKEFCAHPNGHNFTDLFVESARHHAYFVGHIYAFLIPVFILSLPTLIVMLALEKM
jgi:hypothetical protein